MKKSVILFAFILLTFSFTSFGQVSTYKGQALFIWNFTKHIKWQSNPNTFVIGVLGKSEISGELIANLKGKMVEAKPIEVKVLSSVNEASSCQIVYVPSSKSKELNSLNTAVAKDVLIITEDDLSAKGAAISFLMVDEKLRFKINQEAITKGGLQISSGLMSLAMR